EPEVEPAPEPEAVEPAAESVEPEPEGDVDATGADTGPADDGGEAEAVDETDADAAVDAEVEPVDDFDRPAPSPDEEALLERRDGITDELERLASRAVKRVLADEQN